VTDTPFEGGSWPSAAVVDRPVAAAASRYVLRLAGGDEAAARTVLTALGLIPDPLHRPMRHHGDHPKRWKAET
jgi:hypothetical protein